MTIEYPFLIRKDRSSIYEAQQVRSAWMDIHRPRPGQPKDRPFTVVEKCGVDKKRLNIRGRTSEADGLTMRDGFGRKSQNHGAYVDATAAGVKSVVRRIREQEAERLAEYDAQIADLEARIKALRQERKTVVAEAWQKAHVVRLNEALPEGDAVAKVLA